MQYGEIGRGLKYRWIRLSRRSIPQLIGLYGIYLVAIFTLFAILGLPEREVCWNHENAKVEDCAPYNISLALIAQTIIFLNNGASLLSALASILIAGFTYTLWHATNKLFIAASDQARLTDKALALAREEFNATNRPRLKIRNIVVRDSNDVDFRDRSPFKRGATIVGTLTIANAGGTAATIVSSFCSIYFVKGGLPMRCPYEGRNANDAFRCEVIKPGETRMGSFAHSESITEVEASIATSVILNYRESNIYVMGWVKYVDESTVLRKIAFCREYCLVYDNRTDQMADYCRFVVVNEPDYEYDE